MEFVSATFELTDGVKIYEVSADSVLKWKLFNCNGDKSAIFLKSDYNWNCLRVNPNIDADLRKAFGMAEDDNCFFELGVTTCNDVLTIDDTATMVRQLNGAEIRKVMSPLYVNVPGSMIPKIVVTVFG